MVGATARLFLAFALFRQEAFQDWIVQAPGQGWAFLKDVLDEFTVKTAACKDSASEKFVNKTLISFSQRFAAPLVVVVLC